MDKDKKVNGERITMATSSMGVINCAKGKAAQTIQSDLKNPNINKDVIKRSSQLAASIVVRAKKEK